MRLPKISLLKIFFFLSIFFVFLLFFKSHASAYNPGQEENPSNYYQQFNEGLNSPSWEKSSFDFTTFNNILSSISTNILGSENPNLAQAMGGSFVGGMNNLIATMYTKPPASSREYLADLGSRLKIVKPTYAQGVGYGGLQPIMGIWTTFRNLAYIFFAIIFVVTGFAIMFRVKVNPQTVVTLQNALPKIIVSLILVTFSYAIAGFMIDLIYVVILLIFALIGSDSIVNQDIFGLTSGLLGGWQGFDSIFSSLNTFTKDLFSNMPGGISTVMGFAIGGLGTAVIAVAIAFSVFKIFFSLLISYISIIAGVVFSPMMLMLGAIPGQNGLNNWLKLMISNIIPFPLVAAMFGIGGKLMASAGVEDGNLWVAPFIGINGGVNETSASIPVLIGLAIVIATPTVIASVQKSIGAPGIGGIASGVAAPIAAAGRLVATPVTYPVGRARAGMEKAYESQIARGAEEGGIRGAFGKTFVPFRKAQTENSSPQTSKKTS
jgi:hypothetical protein